MSKENPKQLLKELNETYEPLHRKYEEYFWLYNMGDHSVEKKMNNARDARDAFRANVELFLRVQTALPTASKKDQEQLGYWVRFFNSYQLPEEVLALRKKIADLENKLEKKRNSQKTGYHDPKTKKFIATSEGALRSLMVSHHDEKVRKACFTAIETMVEEFAADHVEIVCLRNEFARKQGFNDFFEYRVKIREGMSKDELSAIFDTLYEKTKFSFKAIREREETQKGLRKPWNKTFMLAGDMIIKEDAFYPFEEALMRWGGTFRNMGITYAGGTLQIDLLDRPGKHTNGFCHDPMLVHYLGSKRIPGATNFTANVAYGEVGEGKEGYRTLFHEGGHAADNLNSIQKQVCVNHEYAPSSNSWAETHSIFLETVSASIEWKMRYAHDSQGNNYPFELYEEQLNQVYPLRPLRLMSVCAMVEFERGVYEMKNITKEKLLNHARKTYKKYTDTSAPSLWLLFPVHNYVWEYACTYAGYGLAELAVAQWREYFYKKYGYIVDNPKVGKEMQNVWKFANTKPFPEMVKLATGKKLTPGAYLKNVTMSLPKTLKLAHEKIDQLKTVKKNTKPINLDANIKLLHGKKVIADNTKSFEDMAEKYEKWLKRH